MAANVLPTEGVKCARSEMAHLDNLANRGMQVPAKVLKNAIARISREVVENKGSAYQGVANSPQGGDV